MAVCVIDGCGKKMAGRGWCDTHWHRWRRHGDPLWVSKQRPRGTGGLDRRGYIRLVINGKMIFEHRHVWEKHNGPIPDGYVIHHINGVRHDNRIENLEAMKRRDHSVHHSPVIYVGCKVNGCDQPHTARGLCQRHLDQRRYRLQHPTPADMRLNGAKLTLDQVGEIRDILSRQPGVTLTAIAARYGVTRISISNIRDGITWRDKRVEIVLSACRG